MASPAMRGHAQPIAHCVLLGLLLAWSGANCGWPAGAVGAATSRSRRGWQLLGQRGRLAVAGGPRSRAGGPSFRSLPRNRAGWSSARTCWRLLFVGGVAAIGCGFLIGPRPGSSLLGGGLLGSVGQSPALAVGCQSANVGTMAQAGGNPNAAPRGRGHLSPAVGVANRRRAPARLSPVRADRTVASGRRPDPNWRRPVGRPTESRAARPGMLRVAVVDGLTRATAGSLGPACVGIGIRRLGDPHVRVGLRPEKHMVRPS